ncbi:Fur family transcriptional regulator [uncultured Mycobacterium sp.]|uniref:Fur family transcriptional regulator n=1 Tax=uncultured Mycobacterium sp. TaxID=171292 RepID=UPI0035CB507D
MPARSTGRRRRSTVNRQTVLDVLSSSDNFRSAQQLYAEIREHRAIPIALTTVYRILHALADEFVAETQRAEDGEVLYRLRTGSEHRHYLLCRGCGHAVAFTPAGLEQHTSELTEQYHYADVAHYIDLYGTCPQCRGTGTG